MVGGLGVLALSILVGWGVYERSRSLDEWDAWIESLGGKIMSSTAVGAALATRHQRAWRCGACTRRDGRKGQPAQ